MLKNVKKLLIILAMGSTNHALAETWPERAPQWVVPYPAGGGTDVIARIVSSDMQAKLGHNVVVENKPGASTIIGATYIQNAKPDGYVFGSADIATLAFNPMLYNNLQYDPANFTYLGGIARFPFMIVVSADAPFKNVSELIEAARKTPGKITGASAGQGSPHHLALERFNQINNIKTVHVPYKGAAPAMQDVIARHADFAFIDLASVLSNIQGGKLKVLAVATKDRLALLPDVPTMNESGVPNFESYSWQGLIGPKNISSDIAAKITATLMDSLGTETVKNKINEMGVEPMPMPADEFKEFVETQRKEWAEVIQASGLKFN